MKGFFWRLRSIVARGRSIKKLHNGAKPRRLICYLKGGASGWIYEYLWRDLCATRAFREVENLKFCVASDLQELQLLMSTGDALVVVFPGHLNSLIKKGIPPERVILYFAHVRAGVALPCLNRLHSILCLNSFEMALMKHEGVDVSRLRLFPIGYSKELFYPRSELEKASYEWDVLFVGRYVSKSRTGYHRRKRLGFLASLANRLVEAGTRVALIGPGWGDCEYSLDSRVVALDCEHSATPAIFRSARLVCSVSAQEGGPVSFLEGLACGCLMVSTPSGFAAEFQSGSDGVWLMPLSASVRDWVQRIEECLSLDAAEISGYREARSAFLSRAEFEDLAQVLLDIADEPRA